MSDEQLELPGVGSEGVAAAALATCNCSLRASRRTSLRRLFEAEKSRALSIGELLEEAQARRMFCWICAPPEYLRLQLYHMRQDGLLEKVGRGQFRYRECDRKTGDFVYARRQRKS